MTGQKIKLAGTMLALMLIIIGCKSSATQPTLTLTPAASPTLPPVATVEGSFPIGKFTNGTGNVTWAFLADGKSSTQYPTTSMGNTLPASDPGTYTVTGNQITINSGMCTDVIGTYTWTYDGNALSFKSLGDKCSVREFYLELGQYVKQP